MIIGITGTIGAGKGTVVEYLKLKGFAHYSSSDILKEILIERELSLTRLHMSELADELMHKYKGGVLEVSHNQAQKAGVNDYILESIHRESEADYIRSLGGVILGLDADLETRFERTSKRGEGEKDRVTFEEFKEHALREDEGATGTGPNIREVLKNADYTVVNNGTLEELNAALDKVVAEIQKKEV